MESTSLSLGDPVLPESDGSDFALTKADRAYEALRSSILNLELLPGTVIKELEVMQRLDVGRTPLREALQRLASDGLVTVLPHRGTLVSNVSPHEIEALFELRRELDGFAARLAATHATAQDIRRLRALMDVGVTVTSTEQYDRRIHELIAEACHNSYVETTWRRIYTLSVWMLNSLDMEREDPQATRDELAAVIDAIEARDGSAAARAAQLHVLTRGWFPGATDIPSE